MIRLIISHCGALCPMLLKSANRIYLSLMLNLINVSRLLFFATKKIFVSNNPTKYFSNLLDYSIIHKGN
jgi:hypothetical protein